MSSEHKPEIELTPGATYYVEHGWSGCDGSAWSLLPPATREGWEHAAMLAGRLAQIETVEAAMAHQARLAWRSASARGGLSDHASLERFADSMTRWSERLRMALRSALDGDEDWQAPPASQPAARVHDHGKRPHIAKPHYRPVEGSDQ